MTNYSKEFLQETIRVWQPYHGASLSLENAQEITNNAVELYIFLAELEKKYVEKKHKK